MQVNKLNRFASNIVKAQSQSEMIGIIEPLLSPAEEALALQAGFAPVTLGTRILRAETAPLAALALLGAL